MVYYKSVYPIIYNNFGHPKRSKQAFKELDYHFVVIGLARDGFHPLGHIVHIHKNI